MNSLRNFIRAKNVLVPTAHKCLVFRMSQEKLEISVGNIVISTAGKRWRPEDCTPPPTYQDIEVEGTNRYLPLLPRVPEGLPPKNRMRNWKVMRGPCIGEDAELKLKQFAIIALKGGFFEARHIDMMRVHINNYIGPKPYLYAIYRIPPVYKPVTRHPKNAVMGGGKGNIDHYVTPVKARQVIMEVAGKATFEEVFKFMKVVAMKLPVPAIAISHERLQAMYDEERRIEEENENFITFREVVEKNLQGMRQYLTTYDLKHFGKYK